MGAPRLDKIDFNPIVNGAMEHSQRGTLFTQNQSSPQYGLDRWYMNRQTGTANPGNLTMQRSTDVPSFLQSGFNFKNSMAIGVAQIRTTTDPQFHNVGHVIEGHRFLQLYNKKFVYQFWTKCNTAGTYSVVFNPPASTHKWIGSYVDAGSNTWTKRQIAVDMSTHPGAVFLDHQGGLRIAHWFYGSSVYLGGAINSWSTATATVATGQPAFMDSLSSTFLMTGVSIKEVGDVEFNTVLGGGQIDMGFSRAGGDYLGEFDLVRRYCQSVINVNGGNQATALMGMAHTAATQLQLMVRFGTPMRIAPTMTFTGQVPFVVGGGVNTSISGALGFSSSLQNIDVTDFIQLITTTSAMTLGNHYRLEYPGGSAAGSRILFDAEI